MKHSIKVVAAGALAAFALGAQADTFQNTWDYGIYTTWTGWSFSTGGGSQVHTGTELSWGYSGGNHEVTNLSASFNRSALVLGGAGSAADPNEGTVTTNVMTPEVVGKVTHYNNPLAGTYATLEWASLTTVLTLTPKDPAGSTINPPLNLTFTVNFKETENTAGSCVIAPANPSNPCPDIFVLSEDSLDQQFEYNGIWYTVNLVPAASGFYSLSPAACSTTGATAPCFGFWTEEGSQEFENFHLLISGDKIYETPEPGMIGLLGLGLLGAVGASRRRRKS